MGQSEISYKVPLMSIHLEWITRTRTVFLGHHDLWEEEDINGTLSTPGGYGGNAKIKGEPNIKRKCSVKVSKIYTKFIAEYEL